MATVVPIQFERVPDGPFARSAPQLRSSGLAPLPVGGDDGKQPLVGAYTKWLRRPGNRALAGWIAKWPDANVGIATELSKVTIVDIDDLTMLAMMLERFGDTPLKISTPSGGVHLWYRSDGERSRIRIDGLRVDIKAAGGMVVVPPSRRTTGPFAGREYGFMAGRWEDLPRLPKIKPGSLNPSPGDRGSAAATGERNNLLFRFLLTQAPHCDGQDALLDVARSWNLDQSEEPLPAEELDKTAASAWKLQTERRNWLGGSGMLQITPSLLEQLLFSSPKHGADAVSLYLRLLNEHAARNQRGEPFPVAPEAMARMEVVPWSRYRIKNALAVLRHFPLLEVAKRGGTGKGDAHLYRFCSRPAA